MAKKMMSTAQKECVLLMYNYHPNPLMEATFGEKCYNWIDPEAPYTISLDDVKKNIFFREIENINDEKKLISLIKSKLKK